MSGIFRGLQIGISTLMAHQRAIDITSQNIANVNTPGYQRQRVNFRELSGPSGVINPPLMGNGVHAQGISRFVTPFVDEQLRRQRGIQQHAETMENLLRDVESVLTEPSGTGISASLDAFWAAWQDLTVRPVEESTRVALLQTGSQLAATLNQAHGFISELRDNLSAQLRSRVDRINDIAAEIADLNTQIVQANARAGGSDGAIALEQRRDSLLFELSDITDFRLAVDESGLARVTIGNYALVDEGGQRMIELDDSLQPVWSGNGAAVRTTSGTLKALLDMRNETIPNILDELNTLAMGLAENVNQLHREGYGLNGETGIDFWVGDDAATLAVNPVLFDAPSSIATAGVPNSVGDISVALSIAQLATEPAMGGDPPTVSINGFFRSTVTDLGLRIQHMQATNESSQLVKNHLSDRRQAISGVSMDEEVANLLSYEKAFQAGARIINVVDEMLDQVINRMGVVGR